MWPTAERTLLASEALAGLGAPFLLVYLVNNWLFSVSPPEPPHRPTSAFVPGFILNILEGFVSLD